jgi:hypothetical protein
VKRTPLDDGRNALISGMWVIGEEFLRTGFGFPAFSETRMRGV